MQLRAPPAAVLSWAAVGGSYPDLILERLSDDTTHQDRTTPSDDDARAWGQAGRGWV